MSDFEGVLPTLATALTAKGFETLTPVQEAMLDENLTGKDALVSAQTGSGKTVAFGFALATTLLNAAGKFEKTSVSRLQLPQALIIAPTRELALQVKRELEWLYAKTGAKLATCVGGMDYREERRNLSQGVHIVVGTPGRLRDHIERGSLDMSDIKAVVLDEADEMLDLGFRDDLEFILGTAPETRRTLMFSATVPRTIVNLAKKYQNDALRINTVTSSTQHSDIDYHAMMVAAKDKENAIINVLRYFEAQNAIVFCGTRAEVNRLTSRLSNRGFAVVALSGELSQNERSHALQAMRDGRAKVCVATDVAARGIDLPSLELVIHADLPKGAEPLLQRSGRTGRAGKKGVSTLIVPHNARRRAENLLKAAKITAEWGKPPSADAVSARDDERLLADPSLSEEITQAEAAFAEKLLETYGPEKIAAAMVRMYRAGRSAPEELMPVPDHIPSEGKGRAAPELRADFPDGVWFSLSVGRRNKAEPRWLIPLLCKAGNISKADIGGIKLMPTQTFFELKPKSVDKFMKSVGKDGVLEKDISVIQLGEKPDMSRTAGDSGSKRTYNRKPGSKPPSRSGKKSFDKKPYDKKSEGKKNDNKQFGGKKPANKDKPKKPKETTTDQFDPRRSPKYTPELAAQFEAEKKKPKKPKAKKPSKNLGKRRKPSTSKEQS